MLARSNARTGLALALALSLGCRSAARSSERDASAEAGAAIDAGSDARADAGPSVAAHEILRVVTERGTTDWSTGVVGFFPVGAGEAYATYGLHLLHVTPSVVTLDPALSRGLPIQSDPCVAPEIDELHREPTGRLVVTLRDHGSPHFTGGCLDREPTSEAYAWSADRWSRLPAPPPWARAQERAIYTEARVGGRLVRLMGPRTTPGTDGWNPPTASDPLSLCFKDGGRSAYASFEPLPDGLAALPKDLCTEHVAFGATPDDALFVGRGRDGRVWLERSAPPAGHAGVTDGGAARRKRLRVPLPRGCTTRSAGSITEVTDLDAGELTVEIDCRTANDDLPGSWASRVHTFRYDFARDAIKETGARDLSTDDVRRADIAPDSAGDGFSFRRGALSIDGVHLLDGIHHYATIGNGAALAESGGRVFLVTPPRTGIPPAPLTLRDDETPPLEVLRLAETGGDGCGSSTFWIAARVPANETARLAVAREKIAALESAHAELVRGPDALTELRVGDEWVIGRWDPAAFDPMNGDEGHKLRAKHDEWARGVGLRPASTCLPRAPRSAPPPP